MDKIDIVYLTKALKQLRLSLVDLKRVRADEYEVYKAKVEVEEAIKRISRIVAKEL